MVSCEASSGDTLTIGAKFVYDRSFVPPSRHRKTTYKWHCCLVAVEDTQTREIRLYFDFNADLHLLILEQYTTILAHEPEKQ